MRRGQPRRLPTPSPSPEPSCGSGSDASDVEDLRERTFDSSLSNLLLRDWAWGRCYGTDVQRYALAAYRDGLSTVEEIRYLASTGGWGSRPDRIHRDLTRTYLRNVTIARPEVFKVNCLDPTTLKVIQHDAHCLMPHDIFSAMYHHHKAEFDEHFGMEFLPSFWRGASRPGVSICVCVARRSCAHRVNCIATCSCLMFLLQ